MRLASTGLLLFGLVLIALPALAHVPTFPSDNTSPGRAVTVHDAAKSWSFYDRIDGGEVTYYRLTLEPGERLRLSTFTPVEGAFAPSIVLMSPSIEGTGNGPPGVSVPDGMGAVVIEGQRPGDAMYEPFAPAAYYRTTSVDREPTGDRTYLVAVYAPENRSGPVGVTVGYRERFSVVEYATVPFDLVRTRTWEGQHPVVVLGPWVGTLLLGGLYARTRRELFENRTARRGLLLLAALLILGSAFATLIEMGSALATTGPTAGALVTAGFVVAPGICGGWVFRVALRDALETPWQTRLGLLVVAGATLLTWAGFVVGPGIVAFVAVWPTGEATD